MSDCRVIQMVRTSDENYLFIVGFDGEKLQFRTTRAIERVQEEKVMIDKGMVYTNLYNFHVNYLNRFVSCNAICR